MRQKINNNYLKGQVNIKIHPYANVNNLIKFLKDENGLGYSTLEWIKSIKILICLNLLT